MTENTNTRAARKRQKKAQKKPMWKKVILILLLVGAIGVISVGGLFTYYVATAPELDPEELQDPFPSKLYTMNGDVFGDLGEKQRTKIEYDDLPPILIDAVTATEDARFFEHSGIDLKRIGGAILANIKNGFGSEGASTITQQVVENSFLTNEKKIKLKVQEQWLALKLERQYSKKEIMSMYLNKIFYGNRSYGVAKAAENYFNKQDLDELTLPEAAILAGLPQRPSAYNPYDHPDLMKDRMNTVLDLMVRHDKITEKEADEAREVEIASLLKEKTPEKKAYDAFIKQVKKEVEEKTDGADINTDGLKIYTTLDTSVQDRVEALMKRNNDQGINYPDSKKDKDGKERPFQAGMTVLDTKTGAIRAIGGSLEDEDHNEQGWNYAIDGEGRQPGSTFKPILSYGPAIEYEKFSTYHQLDDTEPYDLGNGEDVQNVDKTSHGWVTMREALVDSYNVPTLRLLEKVGNSKAQQFAEGLGVNFDKGIETTDAIGGGRISVTPLNLAGAFRAFGNEGVYNEPYAVSKIVFQDGETMEFNPESEAVMSDYTAYMVTDMLKDVIKEGTGARIDLPGLAVAGKTGTTDNAADVWFSGYTTNYTISVWTGYDGGNSLSVGDSYQDPDRHIAKKLFQKTMGDISKDIDTPDWSKPSSVVEKSVEKGSKPPKLPSDNTPSDRIVTELFVKGTEPESTSEKFEQLDPVNALQAEYNADEQSINVEWDYDSDEDVTFEVSAAIDDGNMKKLSSTDETEITISNVEQDSQYNIQVIVTGDSTKASDSEPKSVKVKTPGKDDEENNDNSDSNDNNNEDENDDDGNNQDETQIPPVSNLGAEYLPDQSMIDVNWSYNGPDASFKVKVDGPNSKTQTVDTNGIEITGDLSPGQYTITVTPVGKQNNQQGQPETTNATVPKPETNNQGNNNSNKQQNNSKPKANNQANNKKSKSN